MGGCTNRAYRDFSIRFENRFHQEIEKIEMRSERGAYASRDFLKPGGVSVIGLGLTYPANDIYKIEWKYSDEEIYRITMDLRNDLPEDFKGDMVFSVTEKNELIFYQWISPYQYDYSIDLLNRSGAIIYKPSIKSSKGIIHLTKHLKEQLLNGDEVRFRHARKFPANALYKVAWVSENGARYVKEVDLNKAVGEDFNGAVEFVIVEGNDVQYYCK